jgi:hypothetical protein
MQTNLNMGLIKKISLKKKPEIVKYLDYIGEKLLDSIVFDDNFLDIIPYQKKLMVLHQTEKLLYNKGNVNQIKMSGTAKL